MQLAYLKRAGLITSRKNSYWTYFRLTATKTSFHRKLIECVGTCFRDVPVLARDKAAAERLRVTGDCCPK